LDRARADAAAARVSVEYVAGDMRQIPWTGRFDRVVNWSTAFGYFDDTTNRAVLDGIVRVLRPGGRLAMDLDNLTAFLASYCHPASWQHEKTATCSSTATTWTR
jgi:SAM-dependent methyltransferase